MGLSSVILLGAVLAADSFKVSGQIVDRDGTPVPEAKVTAIIPDPVASRFSDRVSTTSDAEGRFRFSNVHGEYGTITAEHSGHRLGIAYWSPDDSGSTINPVKVVISQGATCRIKVTDEAGEPVVGAKLSSVSSRFGDATCHLDPETFPDLQDFHRTSNADGNLELASIPANSKTSFVFNHPEFARGEIENVKVNESADATVVLKRGVPIDLTINGLAPNELVAVDLRHSPFDSPSTIIERVHLDGNKLHYVVEPGDYQWFRIMARHHFVAPLYWANRDSTKPVSMKIESPTQFTFEATPITTLTGRIIDSESGKPLKGVYVRPSLMIDNADEAKFESDRIFGDDVETDDSGRFEMRAPAGQTRIEFTYLPEELGGYIPTPDEIDIHVPEQGADIGTWNFHPIPPIRGRVTDHNGQPMANIFVRFRGSAGYSVDPVPTDDHGDYELQLRWLPVDWNTGDTVHTIHISAFDLNSNFAGTTTVDTHDIDAFGKTDIQLEPRDPWAPLTEFADDFSAYETGQTERPDAHDDRLGTPGPSLASATWWNTDQPLTRESLRGKWVLLDYYFTNCGPCREETPKLIRLHNELAGEQFALIGIHIRREPISEAAKYIESASIPYPVMYVDAEGISEDEAAALGVSGYPGYVLIDPNGNVALAPGVGYGPSLRNNKLEIIRALLLSNVQSLPSKLFAVSPARKETPPN